MKQCVVKIAVSTAEHYTHIDDVPARGQVRGRQKLSRNYKNETD